MPNIGVMEINELIYEALWELSFYHYGEAEALLDCQWDPLESIAFSFMNSKISKRSARKLFKTALKQSIFSEGVQGLTLEDAIAGNLEARNAKSVIAENAYSWGVEDQWYIFSSCGPAWTEGKSRDVWECLDTSMDVCQDIIVVDQHYVYFVRSDNVVDGTSRGDGVYIGDKLLNVAHISLAGSCPEDCRVPTFGPPLEAMNLIKEEIQERMRGGLNLVDIFVEAGVQ